MVGLQYSLTVFLPDSNVHKAVIPHLFHVPLILCVSVYYLYMEIMTNSQLT